MKERGTERRSYHKNSLISAVPLPFVLEKPHSPNRVIIVDSHKRAHTHTLKMCVLHCWYCAFFMLIEIEWLSLSENTALK